MKLKAFQQSSFLVLANQLLTTWEAMPIVKYDIQQNHYSTILAPSDALPLILPIPCFWMCTTYHISFIIGIVYGASSTNINFTFHVSSLVYLH
jgi:hypothetical protein